MKRKQRNSRLIPGGRRWRFGEWYVLLFFIVAFCAPFLANEKALLRVCNEGWDFPFLKESLNDRDKDFSACFELHAIVPYSPRVLDLMNADFKGPLDPQFATGRDGSQTPVSFRMRHWLGTNMRGNDLLADIIYGTRVSLFVSLISTCISFLIGAALGFVAGWYGPGRQKFPVFLLLGALAFFFILYHSNNNLYLKQDVVAGNLFALILSLLLLFLVGWCKKWGLLKPSVLISVDHLIQRFMEFFSAIPRIVFILIVVQFLETSVTSVILILGISGWVDIARLMRVEIQRMKTQGFIEAARLSGTESFKLFTGQMLPVIWPSLLVILLYTFAGNMALEASLSFLGFGLPADMVTLGSLVSTGKNYFEAWWMVLFPGLWISGFIYSLFSVSRRIRAQFELK